MNNDFLYILDKAPKKFYCPSCGKKRFVRYFNIEANEYLPERYGRCDRETNCGYHLNPYKDNYGKTNRSENPTRWMPTKRKIKPKPKPKPFNFDTSTYSKFTTPSRYKQNTFLDNLSKVIPENVVHEVAEQYHVGTIIDGKYKGAIALPFINAKNDIRAVQVKNFDNNNNTTDTTYLHSMIEYHYKSNGSTRPEWLNAYINQEPTKVNCLFGEHLLLQYPDATIVLVEAPKTAIYGTLYFGMPSDSNLLWLAVGAKSYLNNERLKVLEGKNIIVYPDLSKDGSTFAEWKAKTDEISKSMPKTKFVYSDLLERLASDKDKEAGNDFADILIKLDWRQFRTQPQSELKNPDFSDKKTDNNHLFEAIEETAPSEQKPLKKPSSSGWIVFVDNMGKLYFSQIDREYFTVYSNVEAYNKRTEIPKILTTAPDNRTPVQLDIENLLITN